MLSSLCIRNYVLIDSLDITFEKGLSVVSGETGAGKSIIIGALSLVLGQRADRKSIRHNADKCMIEAQFDISIYQLESFFQENDLNFDQHCILRRELYSSGKSRAFVNDSPVSLMILKELGSRLIDIHSQHQNLLLGDSRFQLHIVDVMAKNDTLLKTYRAEYDQYKLLKKEQEVIQEKARNKKREEDYIRFQWEQLEEAKLYEEEQEELEQEHTLLNHAEEIKSSLYQIADLLQGENGGGVQSIKKSLSIVESIEHFFPKAKEIAERLHSAYIDLNDLANEADILKEDIDFDPNRLEWVTDRLNLLYGLQQKHHTSSAKELLAIKDSYAEQLKEIDSFDEQLIAIQKQLDHSYKELISLSEELCKKRKQASEEITSQLLSMIATLGIPHARFHIEVEPKKEPGIDGMDDICFLFSAHKSGQLQPVAQTASGGEISRLMLCMKAMIAGNTALPTIIFDEVDMGVSGEIADKMGDIMRLLSKNLQVITITHLPQIAVKGDHHYFVYKEETEQTITSIKRLNEEERVREVARMLSGASLTEASLANARELLRLKD